MTRIPARVRQAVLERDHYACVARVVDRMAGDCRDRFGRSTHKVPLADLELDHVGQMRMGKAAESVLGNLVTLCWWHHRGLVAGRNWATSHRPALREYLARKAAAVSDEGGQLSLPNSPADEPSERKQEARL